MTQEEKEGNKIIAEFDGWVIESGMEKLDNPFYNKGFATQLLYNMGYHISWDELMPVYIRIVKDELYGEDEQGIILFNIMYERLGDGDGIMEVFRCIVDFLKWYNNTKKMPTDLNTIQQ